MLEDCDPSDPVRPRASYLLVPCNAHERSTVRPPAWASLRSWGSRPASSMTGRVLRSSADPRPRARPARARARPRTKRHRASPPTPRPRRPASAPRPRRPTRARPRPRRAKAPRRTRARTPRAAKADPRPRPTRHRSSRATVRATVRSCRMRAAPPYARPGNASCRSSRPGRFAMASPINAMDRVIVSIASTTGGAVNVAFVRPTCAFPREATAGRECGAVDAVAFRPRKTRMKYEPWSAARLTGAEKSLAFAVTP